MVCNNYKGIYLFTERGRQFRVTCSDTSFTIRGFASCRETKTWTGISRKFRIVIS